MFSTHNRHYTVGEGIIVWHNIFMPRDLSRDSSYFYELQTRTGWGHMLKRFADWCSPQPGERTLDIGCGPGLFPALVAAHGTQSFGCDLDKDQFINPLHPHLNVADIICLPYPDNSFDLVAAANLLFLLPDPENALHQIARVLRSGGKICLLNPSENMSIEAATALANETELTGLARDTLLNYAARAEKHHRWSAEEIRILLTDSGFQIQKTINVMGPGLVRFVSGEKQ